ncbi:unnamed protein product, partial [Didymodactylos carnosus]
GDDYGYSEFLKRCKTVIMGSKTYEQVLTFNHWYQNVDAYIFTSRSNLHKIEGENIEFVNENPSVLVKKLRQEETDS